MSEDRLTDLINHQQDSIGKLVDLVASLQVAVTVLAQAHPDKKALKETYEGMMSSIEKELSPDDEFLNVARIAGKYLGTGGGSGNAT